MSISEIVRQFRDLAVRKPEHPAIIGPNQRVTYSQLERRTAAVARQIAERVEGPTVALLCSNNPSFAPLCLGAMWAGKSIAVLPTLAPPQLWGLMMQQVGAKMIVASEEFIPKLVESGIPCWLGDASQEIDPETQPQGELQSDFSVLLYTSGTTGRPKGVMLSETNILSNIEGCRIATGFDDKQTMLALLPLFHAYGKTVTLLLPLLTGATVVVPERFIPRHILQLIEQYRVSCLIAVPSQYRLLAKESTQIDASSLWLCIAGGERLPEQIARDFEARFGRPLLQGYGTTESSPVISLNPLMGNRPETVGRPLPNLKVTIRDEEDKVLPVGELGEVCLEGGSVMHGYYGDVAATAKKIRAGVLHTGDKGMLDEAGYLKLAGRADDLVKVSGEKVYPAEVEQSIERIEGVDEAAVVAFPDEKHGARLHAFVAVHPGVLMDENRLRAECHKQMPAYMTPRGFSFVEQMPRTISGKTDKRALAATTE